MHSIYNNDNKKSSKTKNLTGNELRPRITWFLYQTTEVTTKSNRNTQEKESEFTLKRRIQCDNGREWKCEEWELRRERSNGSERNGTERALEYRGPWDINFISAQNLCGASSPNKPNLSKRCFQSQTVYLKI